MLARFSKNEGSRFGGKKTPEALLKTLARFKHDGGVVFVEQTTEGLLTTLTSFKHGG